MEIGEIEHNGKTYVTTARAQKMLGLKHPVSMNNLLVAGEFTDTIRVGGARLVNKAEVEARIERIK